MVNIGKLKQLSLALFLSAILLGSFQAKAMHRVHDDFTPPALNDEQQTLFLQKEAAILSHLAGRAQGGGVDGMFVLLLPPRFPHIHNRMLVVAHSKSQATEDMVEGILGNVGAAGNIARSMNQVITEFLESKKDTLTQTCRRACGKEWKSTTDDTVEFLEKKALSKLERMSNSQPESFNPLSGVHMTWGESLAFNLPHPGIKVVATSLANGVAASFAEAYFPSDGVDAWEKAAWGTFAAFAGAYTVGKCLPCFPKYNPFPEDIEDHLQTIAAHRIFEKLQDTRSLYVSTGLDLGAFHEKLVHLGFKEYKVGADGQFDRIHEIHDILREGLHHFRQRMEEEAHKLHMKAHELHQDVHELGVRGTLHHMGEELHDHWENFEGRLGLGHEHGSNQQTEGQTDLRPIAASGGVKPVTTSQNPNVGGETSATHPSFFQRHDGTHHIKALWNHLHHKPTQQDGAGLGESDSNI